MGWIDRERAAVVLDRPIEIRAQVTVSQNDPGPWLFGRDGRELGREGQLILSPTRAAGSKDPESQTPLLEPMGSHLGGDGLDVIPVVELRVGRGESSQHVEIPGVVVVAFQEQVTGLLVPAGQGVFRRRAVEVGKAGAWRWEELPEPGSQL